MQARLNYRSVTYVQAVDLDELARRANALADSQATVKTLRHERDTAIREAFAAGYSMKEIAATCHVTVSQISSILGHPHRRRGRPTEH